MEKPKDDEPYMKITITKTNNDINAPQTFIITPMGMLDT
jgi:hypothetical protein